MRSFDYEALTEKKWDMDILTLVAKIHESKGKQDLFIRQKPVELDRLPAMIIEQNLNELMKYAQALGVEAFLKGVDVVGKIRGFHLSAF